MDANTVRTFLPQIGELIEEFLPIIRKWDMGKYAVSIGGSLGKGTWDNHSDVDFRLFHEKEHLNQDVWTQVFAAVERWKEKGITVDGIWPRSIGEINSSLDRWLNGEILVQEMFWTVWGYQLLTDIRTQAVIEDPYNVIAGWKQRLQLYPPKLKAALLNKHTESLRYWRNDYHYQNKVKRGDAVFLAGISSRLVHDMMQVLFALNETYFVGDGQNIEFSRSFQHQPNNFVQRVKDVLYPAQSENMFETQYAGIMSLIDDVLQMTAGDK